MTIGLIGRPAPGIAELSQRRTSTLSEPFLLAGYALEADPEIRVEACACGSAIAAVDAPAAVQAAVRAHQQTPAHVAWRDREGL